MERKTIQVALIDGPSYTPLYACLSKFEQTHRVNVKVAFRGTHPELNRHLQEMFESGNGVYDLISTHTKYAPAQAPYLLSLDEFFSEEELGDFSSSLLELARVDGELKSIPRNFDARLLFYRSDRFTELGIRVPSTWGELGEAARTASSAGYTGWVYPGKESGLFGTFFELLVSGGGRLFDERLQPQFADGIGLRAVRMLRDWYRGGLTPPNLPDMHYDEVSASFRHGESTMVTDWPGYYGLLTEPSSPVRERFGIALTPKGDGGIRAVYCGSHSFAIPAAARNRELAVELLKFMTSPEVQAVDSEHGHVPVRKSVMESRRRQAELGSMDALRWRLLEETMATSVIIPPKFPEYPAAEEILWKAIRRCIVGDVTEEQALSAASDDIRGIVRKYL